MLFCSVSKSSLFLGHSAAGNGLRHSAVQDALAGSQALDKTYHGIVGELLGLEKRAILNIFALLCFAL